MRKQIYNMEFGFYCKEINIFGYRIYRNNDYLKKVVNLQQLVNGTGGEYETKLNAGIHQITAYVDIPEKEQPPIFDWGFNGSALDDILLLLSIFTLRDVFEVDDLFLEDNNAAITADARHYQWGGILRCSLPHIDSEENISKHLPFKYDISLEKSINEIYTLIRTEDWQKKYNKGYFLFLFKNALKRQILESSFIQCWTIWEHLFAVLNTKWLSDDQIRKINADEKISFIMIEYGLLDEVSSNDRKKIKDLSSLRNRLIHFGRFPVKDEVIQDAQLFIRLTEFVISKILGLSPSNVLNTIEGLEKYFNKNKPSK